MHIIGNDNTEHITEVITATIQYIERRLLEIKPVMYIWPRSSSGQSDRSSKPLSVRTIELYTLRKILPIQMLRARKREKKLENEAVKITENQSLVASMTEIHDPKSALFEIQKRRKEIVQGIHRDYLATRHLDDMILAEIRKPWAPDLAKTGYIGIRRDGLYWRGAESPDDRIFRQIERREVETIVGDIPVLE